MRRRLIDVDTVVERHVVDKRAGALAGPALGEIVAAMRDRASALAEGAGGALAPAIPPQIHAIEAIDPTLGDVYAIATRWAVDVPESADVPNQR